MKKLLSAIVITLATIAAQAQTSSCDEFVSFGYPRVKRVEVDATPLCRISYFVLHNNKQRVPYYAVELLLPENVGEHDPRSNDFREDLSVPEYGRSTLNDYSHSGYDRGHMAPANDMRDGTASMSQSFYLSNMVPQVPAVNRGIWRKLELTVVRWVKQDKHPLYVITGPIVGTTKIGNGVGVPDYTFKVVIDKDSLSSIAFLVPNRPESNAVKSLKPFLFGVKDLERMTRLDFFPTATPLQREKLENSAEHFKVK